MFPLAHTAVRAIGTLPLRPSHVIALCGAALLLTVGGFTGVGLSPAAFKLTHLTARDDYVATIHVVENAGGPDGDHHLGMDELIACMGEGDLKFYRSAIVGPESGPDGIVGAEDVVLIKVNQQWNERGGTNTDVLKGLIARIIEHPDGFTGEVVVGENSQNMGTLDWPASNAEDHRQSAMDVINHFATLGWPVSGHLWDPIRSTSVPEYVSGDMQDGYVVGDWDSHMQFRVNYPKFRTAEGSYVSLKHGIWDTRSETYDDSRFTFINVPVLKSHGAVYGVTATLKHHIGTVTTALGTNSHLAVRYGAVGGFIAQVRMPDLEILDCIYILARPDAGPWCTYEEATRVDKLVAGRDPVAIDMWATVNILIPTIISNGFSEYPKQDPNDSSSIFRTYLDNTRDILLDAGIDVTSDLERIEANVCGRIDVDAESGPTPPVVTAYPNPFRQRTTIQLRGEATDGWIRIFDASGRLRRTLRAPARAASTDVVWDGRDTNGRRLPAGVYTYRVDVAPMPMSGKLTILR